MSNILTSIQTADINTKIQLLNQLVEMTRQDPDGVARILPAIVPLGSEQNNQVKKKLLTLFEIICAEGTNASVENRIQATNASLDLLLFLLNSTDFATLKIALHFSIALYPSIFKLCCKNMSLQPIWQKQQQVKSKIILLLGNDNEGVKVNVVKFICGFILVQSLNTMSERDEIHIDTCPMGHPFLNKSELQNEANLFLGQLITVIQANSTSSVNVMTCILNNLFFIAKERSQYIPVLVPLFIQQATTQLEMNLIDFRSVQKTLKNLLIALLRLNETASFHSMIANVLIELGAKQYEINAANKKRIEGLLPNAKRQPGRKRTREDSPEEVMDLADYILTTLDVSRFDLNLVVDAILTTLLRCDQRRWRDTIQQFSKSKFFASTNLNEQINAPSQSQHQGSAAANSNGHHGFSGSLTSRDPRSRDPRTGGRGSPQLKTEEPIQATQQITRIMSTNDALNMLRAGTFLSSPIATDTTTSSHPDQAVDFYEDTTIQPEELAPAGSNETSVNMNNNKKLKTEKEDQVKQEEQEEFYQEVFTTTSLDEFENDINNNQITLPNEEQERQDIFIDIFLRILNLDSFFKAANEIDSPLYAERNKWISVLMRMIFPLRGESVVSQKTLITELLLDFAFESFYDRYDLVSALLYHEYLDSTRKQKSQQQQSNFEPLLRKIVSRVLETLDVKEKSVVRFFSELCQVQLVFDDIKQLCETEDKCQAGFVILKEYMNVPVVQSQVWQTLLNYCLDSRKMVRSMAIVTSRKWYMIESSLSKELEEFSVHAVKTLVDVKATNSNVSEHDQDHDKVQEDEENKIKDENLEGENHEDAEMKSSSPVEVVAETEGLHGGKDGSVEVQVASRLELFLVICTRNFQLFSILLETYPNLSEEVQTLVKSHVKSMVHSLVSKSMHLTSIEKAIQGCTKNTVDLILVLIREMSGKLSDRVLQGFKARVIEWGLEEDYILTVLHVMSKVEIQQNLYKVLKMLDGSQEKLDQIKEWLVKLVENERIDASSLFALLHTVEPDIGLKRCLEVTNAAMNMPKTFTQTSVVSGLESMIMLPRLPTLYMRSMLQAINVFKLDRKLIHSLLMRLAQRQIWKETKLWEGFKRCCIMMVPHSFPVILSLPKDQQNDLVSMGKLETRLQEFLVTSHR